MRVPSFTVNPTLKRTIQTSIKNGCDGNGDGDGDVDVMGRAS